MNTRNVHIQFRECNSRMLVPAELMPRAGNDASDVARANLGPESFDNSRNERMSNFELVERLGHSELFREYPRAFQDLTGLPLTLLAVGCWQLAHSGNRHQNGFCALMSRANRSCAACLRTQQRVCDGLNGAPCTLSCSFGITETAMGVKIGERIIAYLQTGQIFFRPPTAKQTHRALRQMDSWRLDLDLNEAARCYSQPPVVRRREYQATVRLLQFFADQIGALANQIVFQQQDTEPTQITRARQVIETDYQEDLSLVALARQVGMSAFYFCRRFKKTTGMNFTQYGSRVRVGKAKGLRLNPNYRVSEVAFEGGFQSLAHFNRIFRSLAGLSPTAYRHEVLCH